MKDYKIIVKMYITKVNEIIGPVSVSQANKLRGIKVNGKIKISGNAKLIFKKLVSNYKYLIGPVAFTLANKIEKLY